MMTMMTTMMTTMTTMMTTSDGQTAVGKQRLESMYRNALILTFGGGTNEVQRDIIAMAGLGMPNYKN